MADFLQRLSLAERRDSNTADAGKEDAATVKAEATAPPPRPAKGKPAKPPGPKASLAKGSAPAPTKKRPATAGGAARSKRPGSASGGAARAPPAKEGSSIAKPAARNPAKEIRQFGFEPLGPIAAGAFSTILRAKHTESGVEVAVKTFPKRTLGQDDADADAAEEELEMLRLVSEGDHAHIANMLGECESAQGVHAMLLYCGGGSLLSHLGKLRRKQMSMVEVDAVVCTAQIGSALQFLHSIGVAHRDVKPGNVLHDGRRWRLCDFGFATLCNDQRLRKTVGTMAYLAPEVLGGEGYTGSAVDSWAFGCMIYEMLLGRPCFIAPTLPDLQLRIKNGFKAGIKSGACVWMPHVKPPARSMIGALLASEPEKRLNMGGVLNHAWVTKWCAPSAPPPPPPQVGGATDAGSPAASTASSNPGATGSDAAA